MRRYVLFRYPASFVPVSEEDGILATSGDAWFRELLKRIPALEVDDELCQEDWGVVAFVKRDKARFWIGLSIGWDGEEGTWLAHLHHASLAWLQRLSSAGKKEMDRLIADFHQVLISEPAVTEIRWYRAADVDDPRATASSLPAQP